MRKHKKMFNRYFLREAKEDVITKYDQLQRRGINISYNTLEYLIECDPTSVNGRCGKFVDWLIREYTTRKFDLNRGSVEDLQYYLTVFNTASKALLANGMSNNIYDYTIYSLSKVTRNPQICNVSWMNHLNKFKGQYEIVGQFGNWLVVRPTSWEAERYFGQYTEWCTVGNKDYFDRYSADGCLFIMIPTTKGYPDVYSEDKYQFSWDEQNGFCAADVSDSTVNSIAEFEESFFPFPKDILVAVARRYPKFQNALIEPHYGVDEDDAEEIAAKVGCEAADMYLDDRGVLHTNSKDQYGYYETWEIVNEQTANERIWEQCEYSVHEIDMPENPEQFVDFDKLYDYIQSIDSNFSCDVIDDEDTAAEYMRQYDIDYEVCEQNKLWNQTSIDDAVEDRVSYEDASCIATNDSYYYINEYLILLYMGGDDSYNPPKMQL